MGDKLTADFSGGAVNVITYKLGDINDDGIIDILDAILLQRIWWGDHEPENWQRQVADVNRDGNVDANDLLLLLLHIADPDIYPLD